MEFKLEELKSITNDFSKDHKVGCGGYGDVYKAVHEGKEIAVKRLHQLQRLDDKEFENEFCNFSNIDHENVVKLLGYCHVSRRTFVNHNGERFFATEMERILCFEYMQGGSLDKYIKDDSCDLEWSTCFKIIKGTCEGINHLHTAYEKPILHLDIKPANILLDNKKNAKIADLGLSRLATRTLVTQNAKGTLGHMPPEYQNGGCVTSKNDMFGLGVLIIQLMDGKHGLTRSFEMGAEPFLKHVHGNWNNRLQKTPGHPSREIEISQVTKCVEIALRCVQVDRHKRPSAKEVVDELKKLVDESKDTITQGLHASKNFSSLRLPDRIVSSSSGMGLLDVVIIYAFDCSDWTSEWYTVDYGVFWMVQKKLSKYQGSRLGYIYPMVDTYTLDMKLVDREETEATGFKAFARRKVACTKNMALGLNEAHKMISYRGDPSNGIILVFSDGLINKGDFFDGAEEFDSKVPVHVFTLGGVDYNQIQYDGESCKVLEFGRELNKAQDVEPLCTHLDSCCMGLHAIAENSPGGKFYTTPVPERPMLSQRFSLLLDSIFDNTTFQDENLPSPSSENQPLDVVLIYAFDCTESTSAWNKVDGTIFWMVQKKLTCFENSCMGYIYPMLTPNTYTSDMKLVDPSDAATGYKPLARRRISCIRNMASGLIEANKMIRNREYRNGIILLFSDGLINKGDFFDGIENFRSEFPVHTFTLGGDAYNHVLKDIAHSSVGGTFNPVPVPDMPDMSVPFSELLDNLLSRGKKAN